LLVIFRQRAREIVDIDEDPGNMNVTDAGADVGTTDVKKVRTQSSDGVFRDFRDRLNYSYAEQESANHLVTVEDETWN